METASKLPDFTENNMEKTLFVNCALDGAKLTKVRAPMLVMQKCSCRKITAEDCDLTQIVAMETDFTESGFARCRLCLGGFIGSNRRNAPSPAPTLRRRTSRARRSRLRICQARRSKKRILPERTFPTRTCRAQI